jgi:hypothetical protein
VETNERQRHVALGFGATGFALVGTSLALLVWNNGRYEDWRANPAASGAAERATELQRIDDLTVGTAVLGATALVTAGILWLTSGSPEPPSKARQPH